MWRVSKSGVADAWVQDSALGQWQQAGYTAAEYVPDSQGGGSVDPALAADEQAVQDWINLSNAITQRQQGETGQYNAATQRYQAQTGAEASLQNAASNWMQTQGNYLTGLSNELRAWRGPENLYQFANLMRGQQGATLPAFVSALLGQDNGLVYKPIPQEALHPVDWTQLGAGQVLADAQAQAGSQYAPTPAWAQPAAPAAPQQAAAAAPAQQAAQPQQAPQQAPVYGATRRLTASEAGAPALHPTLEQETAWNVPQDWLFADWTGGNPVYHSADGSTHTIAVNPSQPQTQAAPATPASQTPVVGAQQGPQVVGTAFTPTVENTPALANNPNAQYGQRASVTVQGPQSNEGKSKIAWKNRRESAGIRADESNPEIDRQFKGGQVAPGTTFDTSHQASSFYGNRDTEGNPVEGGSIYNPDTKQYEPYHKAGLGAARVVTGPQTFHVGESGRDELVMVVPLERPGMAVPGWAAQLANSLLPGHRPGPYQAGKPIHAAEGVATYVYGGGYPGVPAPRAAMVSGQQAWSGTPGAADAVYTNSAGQVQAPSAAVPGSYVTIPASEATPLPNPQRARYSNMQRVLDSPLEKAALESLLSARGIDPDSFWSAYRWSLPRQNLPSAIALGRAI